MATDTLRARRYFYRGVHYYERAKWVDAVNNFRDALELFPEHLSARMHLGVSLAQQRLYLDAVRVLDEGRLQPHVGEESMFKLLKLLALICDMRQDHPAADYYLQAALLLRPQDAVTRNKRASVLCKFGRFEEGFELYLQVAQEGGKST